MKTEPNVPDLYENSYQPSAVSRQLIKTAWGRVIY